MLYGLLILARVAFPPSPVKLPATRFTSWVALLSLRTWSLPVSIITRFPEGSRVRPAGVRNCDAKGEWPLPSKPLVDPTTVLMMLVERLTARIRASQALLISRLAPLIRTPTGRPKLAFLARPPSPAQPAVPLPTRVLITPLEFTIRTRRLS